MYRISYMFQGQEVFIVNTNNPKFKDVSCLDIQGNQKLIPVTECDEVLLSDCELCLDDYFAETWCGLTDIVYSKVVDINNPKKLISGYVSQMYLNDDLIERELLTETTKEYDWISERRKFIEMFWTKKHSFDYVKAEWDKTVSKFEKGNALSPFDVDFDEVWSRIKNSAIFVGRCIEEK